MLRIQGKTKGSDLILIAVFYVLLLQNALSGWIPLFGYADELIAMLGIGFMIYQVLKTGKLRLKKSSLAITLCVILFSAVGLLGNAIYGYQPLGVVLTDLLVNLKFFLSILSGVVLFRIIRLDESENPILVHARVASAVMFVLLVADQLFELFPSPEMRYEIRVATLIYGHPTYLAGAMVFLLTVQTMFYEKKNRIFIAMDLVILVFTLRGKAIAGAAAYILIVCFVLYFRKKIKLWHLILIGVGAVFIAQEQIQFYFVELGGKSARSVLTQTSLEIMQDYFPIGTGFGTYGSNIAGEHYSPVYVKYGFLDIYELDGTGVDFFDDTFWPIIIGQTGFIGTLCYVLLLIMLFVRILKIRDVNNYAYAAGIFAFVYLVISSTSEPAFNNSIAIPPAVMLGYIFTQENQRPKKE